MKILFHATKLSTNSMKLVMAASKYATLQHEADLAQCSLVF